MGTKFKEGNVQQQKHLFDKQRNENLAKFVRFCGSSKKKWNTNDETVSVNSLQPNNFPLLRRLGKNIKSLLRCKAAFTHLHSVTSMAIVL